MKPLSRVQPSATPRTAAHQAPPSMGFSRQEYWSGVPLPSPRDRLLTPVFLGFPCGSAGKQLPATWETWVRSLGWEDPPGEGKGYPLRHGFSPCVGKIPWRKGMAPLPVFLPGKSRGHRSLVSISRRGLRESDTTKAAEQAHTRLINSTAMNTPRYAITRDVPGGSVGKKSACQCQGHRFHPWSRKIPHASEQLSPMHQNYRACAQKPQEKPLQ